MAEKVTPLSPADILTVKELAARLKVCPTWVYERMRPNQRKGNPLPVFKMGRYLRFSWPAICQWLESQARQPQQGKAK